MLERFSKTNTEEIVPEIESMNAGCPSVKCDTGTDPIDREQPMEQNIIGDKEFITRVTFDAALTIVMVGKKRTSLFTWN